MLWLLLPALLLPVAGLTVPSVGAYLPSTPDDRIAAMAETVFNFILLGSMTLNAWLALRSPTVWATQRISLHLAWGNLALYVLTITWLWLTTVRTITAPDRVPTPTGPTVAALSADVTVLAIAAAIGVAGTSIVCFVLSLETRTDVMVAFVRHPSRRRSRRLAWSYLAVTLAAASAVVTFSFARAESTPVETVPLVGTIAILGFDPPRRGLIWIPVAVNVSIAVVMILSTRARTSIVRRFFRLTPPRSSRAASDDLTRVTGCPSEP